MSKKGGLPWFAWVGIGCGVLVLLGVVAVGGLGLFVSKKVQDIAEDFEERPVYTTAAAIARFNPEIELVEADEEKQTVTLRSVESGETMTFHLDDIKSGNFSFETDGKRVDVSSGSSGAVVTTDDGEMRFGSTSSDDLPSWVPVPRGAKVQAGFSSSSNGNSTGMVQLLDFESIDGVLDFYRDQLSDAGFELSDSTYNSGGARVAAITATRDRPQQSVNVVTNRTAAGEEQVTINYSGVN